MCILGGNVLAKYAYIVNKSSNRMLCSRDRCRAAGERTQGRC